MKKFTNVIFAVWFLTCFPGCHRKPVYRPVEYVADSLVHNDVPSAYDENQQVMDDIDEEGLMIIPDIPQESDLLQDGKREDIERIIHEGL